MTLIRIAAIIFAIAFLFSCNKGKRPPIVTTAAVYEIFPKTAKGGGILYSEGNSNVTEKGLCWNTIGDPTVNNSKVLAGEGAGNFSAELTGLDPDNTYYVRAYAINSFGISYGRQTQFTTLSPTPLPSLITSGAYSLSTIGFNCAGSISSLNSGGLITVGLCWNTNPQPTIDNDKTAEPFSALSYTHSVRGLNPNTIYYVRSYATNNSGITYGNELIIRTYYGTLSDIDGNIYDAITIGSQVWMIENLRVSKYSDGSPITNATDSQLWLALNSGGYCLYNNDPANEKAYGKLYNWRAVNDVRKVAPLGWHIPSDNEWLQLQNYLGGPDVAGQKIKSSSLWYSAGNNQVGFNALPAGGRGNTGLFEGLTFSTGFWSSTAENISQSSLFSVLYNTPKLYILPGDITCGYSVRCVKD